MTIEKALDMLGMIEFKDTEAHLHTWYKGIDDDMNEAVRTVIETFEAEFSTDCISRQAVLDYIYNDLRLGNEEIGNDVERQMELYKSYKYVKSLPPVNPQRTGHWINVNKNKWNTIPAYKCSACGANADLQDWSGESPFCPWCGAKMVESQESEGKI